ncbi:uncharacterized protein LOC136096732 [Hydra vulgaris]|uniref:uncharacterized protein LOC136096732 n=1 Tax=Hydra vulgaris TaxID=6087 RepID=UPI0032EA8299
MIKYNINIYFASLTAANFKMFTERLNEYEKDNINNLQKISKIENDLEITTKKVISLEAYFTELKKYITTSDQIATEKFEVVKKESLGLKEIKIERAHRTGIRDGKKVRSIVLKLLNYKDKERILKNSSKLKGKNIYINEDYCAETVQIRKELRMEMKKAREGGKFAFISYDKLIVQEWSPKEK